MKLSNYSGEGNLNFCCIGSWESYLGQPVSQQNNNNNNPKFKGWHIYK